MTSINNSMVGKTVVVTGATSGIGLGAVMALVETGARVIGVGRNPQRCELAQKMILARHPEARVHYLLADLAEQRQVRGLAVSIQNELVKEGVNFLDALVNNAGIYSGRLIRTSEGIELTLAVNHLAAFLLTHELLLLLNRAPFGRVVTVSSSSHYKTWINPKLINHPHIYIGFWEYKVSKLANILFTLELNQRFFDSSIRAFAVDPGLVNTEIGMKGTRGLTYWFWNNHRKHGVLPDVPAKTILYLCHNESIQKATELYWKDSKPKQPSKQALNRHTAQELWEISKRMCGIDGSDRLRTAAL